MKIRDSVAFVTGANRGLGLVFAQELLATGARKVYAAARNPEGVAWAGRMEPRHTWASTAQLFTVA
jgi:NAD(P)-dependent dehydrogenase (short-subunit alcohol dehydrogenase family)